MPLNSIGNVQTLSLPAPPASVRSWRVGAILQATVLESPAPGTTLLQIGGTRVQAVTAQPLQPGTTLTLQVVGLDPQPTLQRIESTDTAAETRNSALRSALPRQGGLAPLLANLMEIAGGGPARDLIPRQLIERITELLQSLPQQQQVVTESGLKAAIEDSGVFLEARLAASAGDPTVKPPVNDMKAALLRLSALLEGGGGPQPSSDKLPPPTRTAAPAAQAAAAPTVAHSHTGDHVAAELSRQVDAALARIQVGQITIAGHQGSAAPYWIIELPVRTGDTADVLQLRIEREPRPGRSIEADAWALTLAMDLAGLGPLYARISFAEGRIGTRLWAESEATHKLIEQHAPVLEQSLKDAGLTVSGVTCSHGAPPGPTAPFGDESGLVDLQV